MALEIEFANVIARKDVVEACWPGGLDAFAAGQPNCTEDDALVRVGFMSTHEAADLLAALDQVGVVANQAAALVTHLDPPPPWLTVGECSGRTAVWVTDRPAGELVRAAQGFLLRGPAELAVRFPALVRAAGITASPSAPDDDGNVTWTCRDGDAELAVLVLAAPGARRAGFWGTHDVARRRSSAIDRELGRKLTEILTTAGATST